MMTREEELIRANEDRDELERDLEYHNEQLIAAESEGIPVDDTRYEELLCLIKNLDNEIASLNSYIVELELGVDL